MPSLGGAVAVDRLVDGKITARLDTRRLGTLIASNIP